MAAWFSGLSSTLQWGVVLAANAGVLVGWDALASQSASSRIRERYPTLHDVPTALLEEDSTRNLLMELTELCAVPSARRARDVLVRALAGFHEAMVAAYEMGAGLCAQPLDDLFKHQHYCLQCVTSVLGECGMHFRPPVDVEEEVAMMGVPVPIDHRLADTVSAVIEYLDVMMSNVERHVSRSLAEASTEDLHLVSTSLTPVADDVVWPSSIAATARGEEEALARACEEFASRRGGAAAMAALERQDRQAVNMYLIEHGQEGDDDALYDEEGRPKSMYRSFQTESSSEASQ